MFTRHADHFLSRYCDGELSAAELRRVDAHLASCAHCRAALEEIRFSAGLMRQVTTVGAPHSVWHGVDAALSQLQRPSRTPFFGRWAAACALILAIGFSAYWWTRGSGEGAWEVTRTDGASRRMAGGEWVETDARSRARIVVGNIGTVDVAAGTRIRLGDVQDSEYRLSLERGTISAEIVAPPRFFIVDTPASTVVDLGCAYTITVGEDGAGELRMTSGWAALEFKGRESLVPAGAICRTRPGTGPGTPYFEDAPAALKRAIDAFDQGTRPSEALDVILREARIRDTLTLWHLLSRVEAADRARVYDRIASFEAPPAGVSRDRVLALDADALRQWREELAWKW
jgi:predicted anti-sigma-YlaC factor YlaD